MGRYDFNVVFVLHTLCYLNQRTSILGIARKIRPANTRFPPGDHRIILRIARKTLPANASRFLFGDLRIVFGIERQIWRADTKFPRVDLRIILGIARTILLLIPVTFFY